MCICAFSISARHTTPLLRLSRVAHYAYVCVCEFSQGRDLRAPQPQLVQSKYNKHIYTLHARRTTEKRLESILIRRRAPHSRLAVNFKRENFSFTIALAAIEKCVYHTAPGAAWEPSVRPSLHGIYEQCRYQKKTYLYKVLIAAVAAQ
jgi:hypothetical protein